MIKVLLLTQWFEPEPTFKGLAFARELKRQGFDVEVVTGFPNYPGGKVYSGYQIRWFQREIIDDIVVNRVPLYPSHDRSAILRVINYISFAISAFIYLLFFSRKVDVIYAYHPPLTVGFVAGLFKLLRRSKMVLDVQDLWPDTLRATGMVGNQHVLSIVGKVAFLTYKISDCVVVLSEGFRNRLIERGVSSEKINVIKNWADDEKINSSTEISKFDSNDEKYFNILFAGNMGSAQAIDAVLDAAKILTNERSRIRFVLMGKGLELDRLKKITEQNGLQNVLFMPAVEMNRVGGFLRAADALLVHLRNDELFEITIPSKIQAYMAVGKPILIAVKGDAATLVSAANCGVVAEPENAVSIAEAANKLESLTREELRALGDNGKEYYLRELTLRAGVEKFAHTFRTILR